jgi:hypothetical protein
LLGRRGRSAPAWSARRNKCAAPLLPAGGEQTSSRRCSCSRCDCRNRVQRPRRCETSTPRRMSSTAAFYLLSTLGGYLLTSFLLLKYPTLLHQKKKQRFLSKHISHRGGELGVPTTRWRRRRGRLSSRGSLRAPHKAAGRQCVRV